LCIENHCDMARQQGILKFTGKLGGLSFYKHKQYGMLVRQSNPVSAERMRQDPAFARTRESASEFGMASKSAKLLRHGLLGFLKDVGTEQLDNRLMQHFLQLKNQDLESARGQRHVAAALARDASLLGGFELHARYGLSYFLGPKPVVDAGGGRISLRGIRLTHVPAQATHVAFTAFCGRMDFEKQERDVRTSASVVRSLDDLENDVVLVPGVPALGCGIEIWGLKVVFLQEVNGELCVLQVGAAGILDHVVEVSNETTLHGGPGAVVQSVSIADEGAVLEPLRLPASVRRRVKVGSG
jgi:hypothetical protein